jgi:hypothetical protein
MDGLLLAPSASPPAVSTLARTVVGTANAGEAVASIPEMVRRRIRVATLPRFNEENRRDSPVSDLEGHQLPPSPTRRTLPIALGHARTASDHEPRGNGQHLAVTRFDAGVHSTW